MNRRLLAFTLLAMTLPSVAGAQGNLSYTIQRRPVPAAPSREIALPTNVVIDSTTWNTTQERSRLPVNPLTGFVEVMVNPNGTMYLPTAYSSVSAVQMGSGVVWFWLAERSDVAAPLATVPALPVGEFLPDVRPFAYAGPRLSGEYVLVSLTARSGKVDSVSNPGFDNPAQPIGALHASFYSQTLPSGGTFPPPPGLLNYQPGIPFGIGLR